MKFETIIKGRSGFTLVETVALVAIASITILGAGKVGKNLMNRLRNSNIELSLVGAKSKALAALKNSEIATASVGGSGTQNAIFNCLKNGTVCTHLSTGPFVLLDSSGNVLSWSHLSTTAGLSRYGIECTGDLDDSNCIYYYKFNAVLVCPGFTGSCLAPIIKVEAELTYRGSTVLAYRNLDGYSIKTLLARNGGGGGGGAGFQCSRAAYRTPGTVTFSNGTSNTATEFTDFDIGSAPPSETFSTIFEKHPLGSDPSGSGNLLYWGLSCKSGWTITGCALNTPTSQKDTDITMSDSLNACLTDDEELYGNGIIYIGWCRTI